MEVHRYSGFVLTGLHQASSATVINAIRVLALLIPLSYLGMHLGGVLGLFFARLATDIIAGCIGLAWIARTCRPGREIDVHPSIPVVPVIQDQE